MATEYKKLSLHKDIHNNIFFSVSQNCQEGTLLKVQISPIQNSSTEVMVKRTSNKSQTKH
jgi:hypothetical protein